jgi:nucleoside-diphosphate-sugar epimerase
MTVPNGTLLVTGATGLVGRETVRQGLERGYHVQAMVRPKSDRSSLPASVKIIEADLLRPETLPEAVSPADLIVHTAAKTGDWGAAHEFRALNVVGLEHLLYAAEATGRLKRFVHISSLSVYPAHDHRGTDETDAIALDTTDPYSRSKVDAEFLIEQHRERYALPAAILRPGTIYGPGDRLIVPRLVKGIESGRLKTIGAGDALMHNTSVRNLGDAIMLALESPKAVGEAFNIRDERLVTRLEYFGAVADYLGKPHPGDVHVNVAKPLARLLESVAHLSGSKKPPLLTEAVIRFMTVNLDFSIAKAQRMLNYQPRVDFRDGIREALDWAVDNSSARA